MGALWLPLFFAALQISQWDNEVECTKKPYLHMNGVCREDGQHVERGILEMLEYGCTGMLHKALFFTYTGRLRL